MSREKAQKVKKNLYLKKEIADFLLEHVARSNDMLSENEVFELIVRDFMQRYEDPDERVNTLKNIMFQKPRSFCGATAA